MSLGCDAAEALVAVIPGRSLGQAFVAAGSRQAIPVTLLPILNPLGIAPVFANLLGGVSRQARARRLRYRSRFYGPVC